MNVKELLAFNKLLERFRRDVNDIYNYKFRVTALNEYELNFTYTAKSKVLKSVFKQVSKHLKRRKEMGSLAAADPDKIERFLIPEQFNNRIHTGISKNIKEVGKVVRQDGYEILRSEVKSCIFHNKEEITEINIKVVGQYVFKGKC